LTKHPNAVHLDAMTLRSDDKTGLGIF